MVAIECQFPNCAHTSAHELESVALAMFNSHLASHQQPTGAIGGSKQKVPPIQRPEIKQDIDVEEWNTFVAEWRHFKRCADISTNSVADQLFQCCERGLGRLLIRENPTVVTEGEEMLLEAMKKMAVIKVATSVRRANLLASNQDHGETFREF